MLPNVNGNVWDWYSAISVQWYTPHACKSLVKVLDVDIRAVHDQQLKLPSQIYTRKSQHAAFLPILACGPGHFLRN